MPSLVFEFEDGSHIVAPLSGRAVIGSAPENDVVAEREDIAARHAEIFTTDDGSWWLRDLGSAAGSFINGARIRSQRLGAWDVVSFGSVTARFSPLEAIAPDPADMARTRLEEVTRSIAEAERRHEMLEGRIKTLAEQERTKLTHMEQLNRELAEIQAHKSDAARALDQSNAKLRANEARFAEVEKISGELERKAAEVESLDVRKASLGKEIQALQSREAEARSELKKAVQTTEATNQKKTEAEASLAKVVDELAKARDEVTGLNAQSARLRDELKAAEARSKELESEAARLSTDNQRERDELAQCTVTKAGLDTSIKGLQADIAAATARLENLKGTEERLLQARADLQKTEAAHAVMTTSLAEITTSRDTINEHSAQLAKYLEELRSHHAWFEQALPALHEQHAEAERKLKEFQQAAHQTSDVLNLRLAELQKKIATEQTNLSIVREEVVKAEEVKAGLDSQNTELKATVSRLDETKAELHAATANREKLTQTLAELEKSCATTKQQLAELESAEKAATARVTHLRATEADLQKTLQSLTADQQRERARFEELRQLANDAQREGERQKAELDQRISALHAEIATLETRLAHAREWHAELDALYAKLADVEDGSPEGVAIWKQAQSRRREITEQLPTGIQVRAPGTVRVVPRGR